MSEGSFKKRKYTIIFAVQLIEFLMVILLLTISCAIAGWLVNFDPFSFGVKNGIAFFFSASFATTILLALWKYFSFFSLSLSGLIWKIIGAVLLFHFILLTLLYFFVEQRLTPDYFILAGEIQILFLIFVKILTRLIKEKLLKDKVSLVITDQVEKKSLIKAFKRKGIHRLSFIPTDENTMKRHLDSADTIYLLSPTSKEMKCNTVVYCALNHKRLFVIPELHEIALTDSEMAQIDDVPLFTVGSFQWTEAQFLIKRIMDIFLSMVGILLTSPILLTAAFFIRREDGGPVLYTQIRSGLNGKPFKIIKLRSMIADAEKHTGAVLATEMDERITKVGRIIRLTRIDEIPQFLNVLKGDMSMVGPRPERPVFVEEYIRDFPEYAYRMAVKPGITGLAQVMAKYTTTAENKLKYDLLYIKNYSPVFDLKIILRTVRTVFTKEQAEGVKPNRKEDF